MECFAPSHQDLAVCAVTSGLSHNVTGCGLICMNRHFTLSWSLVLFKTYNTESEGNNFHKWLLKGTGTFSNIPK